MRLLVPGQTVQCPSQHPADLGGSGRVPGDRPHPLGELDGLLPPAEQHQHGGQHSLQLLPARIVRRGVLHRLAQQLDRHPRTAVGQHPARAGQPVQHPALHRPRRIRPRQRGQQLLGHPLHRRPRLRQRPGRLPVQRQPQPGRRALVQHLPDQRMPERQPHPGLPKHPRGHRLPDHRRQLGHRPAHHHSEIADRELRAQQRRRPQHPQRLIRDEPQPIRDHRRQRHRHPGVRLRLALDQLRRPALPPHPPLPRQRVDHFPHVQRVTGRRLHRPAQPRTHHLSPQQTTHQLGHRLRRQRLQRDDRRAGGRRAPAHLNDLSASGHRPAGRDQQQGQLRHHPAQLPPHQKTLVVGPMQVIHHQQHRCSSAQPVHQGQQPVRDRRHRIRRPRTSHPDRPQQPNDLPPRRIGGPGHHLQAVQHHPQRETHTQLVGGRPEHLAAQLPGIRQASRQQRRLADAGLPLHPHLTTTPTSHPPHQRHQPGHLLVPADQHPTTHTDHHGREDRTGQAARRPPLPTDRN